MAVNWAVRLFLLSLPVLSSALSNETLPFLSLTRPHKFHWPEREEGFFSSLFTSYVVPLVNSIHRHLFANDTAVVTGCTTSGFSVPLTLNGVTLLALVDTGSSTLAVAGQNCGDCGDVSPRYSPSSSATDTGMKASSQYLDGSGWAGDIYADDVILSPMPAVNMKFASIDDQSDFFGNSICNGYIQQNSAQGIIGFAYSKLLIKGTDLYFDNLVNDTGIDNLFALQMCRTTGRLWLGGYNSTFFSGNLTYTPIVEESAYGVTMLDLQVNGNSLGFSQNDFVSPIVDSGTSVFLLPREMYVALVNSITTDYFINEFGSDFWNSGQCTTSRSGVDTATLNANLPKMTIVLDGGVTLEMNAVSSYLFELKTGVVDPPYYYCPGISSGNRGDPIILGWPIMNQFVVVFDRANSRIGWAPSLYCNAQWEGTWTSCNVDCSSNADSTQTTSLYPNATCTDYNTGATVPNEYCLSPPEALQCCAQTSKSSSISLWKIIVAVVIPVVAILACCALRYSNKRSNQTQPQQQQQQQQRPMVQPTQFGQV